MTFDEMKAVADARTKGETWFGDLDHGTAVGTPTMDICLRVLKEEDAAFIAMAANNWDYIFGLARECSFALAQLKREQELNAELMQNKTPKVNA